MGIITSRTNPLIKKYRKRKREIPDDSRMVLIEGIRLVEEALASGIEFEALFYTQDLKVFPRVHAILEAIKFSAAIFFEVSKEVMESLSLEETPPGLLAWVRFPNKEVGFKKFPLLALCGVRDPGNAGSLVRTVEGSEAGIWFSRESVHPFHPKVVKGSMGSSFRVFSGRGDLIPFLQGLKGKGVRVIGTRQRDGFPYYTLNWKDPCVILLGGETSGIPNEAVPLIDTWGTIPLMGKVESLNVSVSGGILLFEALRQRNLE